MAKNNSFLSSPFDDVGNEQPRFVEIPASEVVAPPVAAPAAPAPAIARPRTGKQDFDALFEKYGQEYGVPAALLRTIAGKESSFNPNAVGATNSNGTTDYGLMQHNSRFHKERGITDWRDPEQSVKAAAALLKANLTLSNGDMRQAVRRYNGSGPRAEAYADDVMARFEGRSPTKVSARSADPVADLNKDEPGRYQVVDQPDDFLSDLNAAEPGRYAVVNSLDDELAGAKAKQKAIDEQPLFGYLADNLSDGFGNMRQSLAMARWAVGGGEEEALAEKLAKDYAEREGKTKSTGTKKMDASFKGVSDAEGVVDTTIAGLKAIGTAITNPKALAGEVVGQAANMLPTLGLGAAGAAGGAVVGSAIPGAGTVAGAIVGGRAGMVAGTTATELGAEVQDMIGKRLQAAKQPPTAQNILALLKDPDFQTEARKQGLAKGLTVAAVDQVFLGMGGKIATAPARKAATQALTEQGVDMSTRAARNTALASPAGRAAMEAAKPSIAARAGAGAAAVGVDSTGEVIGEAASQQVARGEIDKGDALREGVASLGSSVAEVGAGVALERGKQAVAAARAPIQATPASPSTAAGPLQRAAENAAAEPERATVTTPQGQVTGTVTGTSEDGQVQIVSDDGEVLTFDLTDGQIQITPEAPNTPLSNALEVAADEVPEAATAEQDQAPALAEQAPAAPETVAEQAPAPVAELPAAEPVQAAKEAPPAPEPKPTPPPTTDLKAMDEPALRERMRYIADQAKSNNGWSPQLVKARREVEKEINTRATATGMQKFAPETGTLGIPRSEMPQVKSEHHGALVNHLNAKGIDHETKTVDAAALKPTQAEYSPEKVERAKEQGNGDRAIIVSNDGHILDGHHQAMAAAENGEPVKAIVLDVPVKDALSAIKAFTSTTTEGANPKTQKALDRIAAGKAWFNDGVKAKDFVTKNGLSDTHEAKKGKGGRWDIVAKVPPQMVPNSPARDAAISEAMLGIAEYDKAERLKESNANVETATETSPPAAVTGGLPDAGRSAAVEAAGVKRSKSGYAEVRMLGKKHFVTPFDDQFVIRDAAGWIARNSQNRQMRFATEADAISHAQQNAKRATAVEAAKPQPKDPPNANDNRTQGQPAGAEEVVGQQARPEAAPAAAVQSDAAPAQEVAKPAVSANKVFTEDAAAKARALLKSKLGQLNSGIDPEVMQAGIVLAGYHIEKGARTFAAYSQAMIADLGEVVKPYLKSWYMGVKYDPRATGMDGMSSAAEVEAADIDAGSAEAGQTMVDHFAAELAKGNMPKDNLALKKMVEAFDGSEPSQARLKQAQEDLEAAIVVESRRQITQSAGQSDRAVFDKLVALYNAQPNLNIRTSTSVENQAYSTPAPLAYLSARLADIGKDTAVYEPTAGNGMLLITADPKNATANELDTQRYENLKAQGIDAMQGDALTIVESGAVTEKSQDAVITNPPFGSVKDQDGKATKVAVDGYKIGKIDHLIAAEALRTLKDDGKATLIIGADKVAGGVSTDDRIFFNWLYSHYNVTSHFEMDGKLYARQGAGWPVRVISINGRAESSAVSPKPGTVQRVNAWEQVYEQFEQSMVSQNQGIERSPAGRADGAGPAAVDGGPAAAAGGKAGRADQKRTPRGRAAGDVAGERAGAAGDQPASAPGAMAEGAGGQRRDDGAAGQDRLEPGSAAQGPAGDAAGADQSARTPRTDRVNQLTQAENAFQAKYTPTSERKDEGVLIPVNMAQPLNEAMAGLEDAVGDIDDFARKELGYKSVAELHDALMGLQVDSVAMAIHNIKSKGKGTIIADQTGIGKGRQAAAIIRWAAKNDKIPVFITVKPSLFTDMFNDLADIGTNDIAPLIVNGDEAISGAGTEKLFANKPGKHKDTLRQIAGSGQLPGGRNAVFLTYSQINTDNVQRQAILALASRAVFVLDESHNAGGQSSTGEFVLGLLENAAGVTYLSATYAKRPDNMPVYFKTDIGEAVADSETLAEAMAKGGLPLQTVVSNNLVKAGQMFRRERSYDGVSITTKNDTKNSAAHEELSDKVTSALRAIVQADRTFHTVFFKEMAKQMAETGARAYDDAGNQASQSVNHTEFSSVVHNFVRQLLLGLKADTAADDAIAAIKRGEKPLIALDNTMGSFLFEYTSNLGIKPGQPLGDFDYRNVLSRALERSRAVSVDDGKGNKEKRNIAMDALDPVTRAAYHQAQAVIDDLDVSSIPVSPLDWIRHRIEQAGYSVAEITGRDLAVDYAGPVPKLTHVPAREQHDKVGTTRGFNSGKTDVVILNVSGSTGISLHSSEKFEDQRPRHMIVAQAAQDINIFMQMLGRIHRTGQVNLPSYTLLNVDLPAEKRPTAILSGKMKSLNANTSSNTESATSVQALDILNKYGDQVIAAYLEDNPELAEALGIEDFADGEGKPVDDLARKVTGRLALMPVATQREFYADIEDQYASLIDYLNKTNQNDLEPRTFDFDAIEQKKETLVEKEGESPFQDKAEYVEFSIKAQGKPMSVEEITAAAKEHLAGKTPPVFAQDMIDGLEAGYPRFLAAMTTDTMRAGADATKDKAITFIKGHRIGGLWRVEINGEVYNAAVINVKNSNKGVGNPYSLSKTTVTLALNGSLRQVSVPATQFEKIVVSPIPTGGDIAGYFRTPPEGERETAKVITGNLLAAYGELKGSGGTIINFSKQDGSIEQGILLPKKFEYGRDTAGDYRFKSAADAARFLMESTADGLDKLGIASRDQAVRVVRDGSEIEIRVPKSKLRGGKYFLDGPLREVVGDFTSKGSQMVATVRVSQRVPALEALLRKTSLYALPSMADDAKAMFGQVETDAPAKPEGEAAFAENAPAPAGWSNIGADDRANLPTLTDKQSLADIGLLQRTLDGQRGLETLKDKPYRAVRLPDADALDAIGAAFGVRPVGFDINLGAAQKYDFFSGVTFRGVGSNAIFLSARSTRPHLALLGHETVHQLKTQRPDLYNKLADAVARYVDVTKYEAEFVNSPVARNVKTAEGKQEEFLGEVVSDAFMDPGFWRTLGQESPKLLKQVYATVLRLLQKLAGTPYAKKSAPYLTDFDRVMQIAGEVLAELGEKPALAPKRSLFGISFAEKDASSATTPISLTPPEQGLLRRVQATVQDNMNRVREVQDRIQKLTGMPMRQAADYYRAETNRPGRTAARLEDARNDLIQPLMEKLAKSGHTQEQLGELLHAQHAQERNERVAAINPDMPDGGSGMTNAEADAVLKKYAGNVALKKLADEARKIAKMTLEIKHAYGLIDDETLETLRDTYANYVPLKGDGEYGPKIKRAMGHDAREEHILENIARDYGQAVVVGEKNIARQSLLTLVLQNPDSELWSVGVPPRGRYIAGQSYNIYKGKELVGTFQSAAQAQAWVDGRTDSAFDYTIQTERGKFTVEKNGKPSAYFNSHSKAEEYIANIKDPVGKFAITPTGERVKEFVKPLQSNEVPVYVDGRLVRIQIHGDEVLANQLRPLDQGQMNVILENMRGVNRYLSKIYTGYNPAFILRNAVRDALTGTINITGNQGVVTAAKAWANYPGALTAMGQFAATGKLPGGEMGKMLAEYRDNGGKTGASWMSDLEEQGRTLSRMFDDAYGASGYLKDGKVGKAALIAGRKMIGGLAHVVEVGNQATENALRLALYTTLRKQGATPGAAAAAAKSVTVDFDRKGSMTGALGAIYLFFNPAVQGTANAIKTLVKGEKRKQAWGALGALGLLGLYATTQGLDEDKDRWLGESWEKRSKTLIIRAGTHTITVPISYEFAPFYAFGVALGEALRGESKMKSAVHIVSSFIDAYFPLGGIYNPDSSNHGMDVVQAAMPTILKPGFESATNRNSFGSQIVPENEFTKDRPDNQKMTRGSKGGVFDATAQGIAKAGELAGAGKYENDMSKVSPETLKHFWRTYTGGLGTFVTDSAGLARLGVEGSASIEAADVPIVKDFYRNNDVRQIRGRFYELTKEARAAAEEFKQAKKAGDGEALDKILAKPEKAELLGLDRLVRSTSQAAAKLRDEEVTINADPKLTLAQKRTALRELQKQEEELYRGAIQAFR